ncbi:hypothetical protein KJI95_11270 [Shewanella sp. JM162201]|uniref:Alginate biosynthesis protein AlgX n=1 Tax=Shewanella jiangmenensis TaxID=2837387 RepID=A0ABS5V5H4_9GAMM|nr:alginate biosynthesis protein AlgX [Shewanella jiangmenensis]MBT1445100.1 hypothetical protein [Shewanella jiangmenensis]
MKTTLWHWIGLMGALLASTAAAKDEAAAPCDDLSCLYCPAMEDPASYATGEMKLMKYLVEGKDRWLFRSEVDLTNRFEISQANLHNMTRLVQELRERGTELVFMVQPTRGLMHRDKLLADKRHGFEFDRARAELAQYLASLRASGALVPDILQLIDNPPKEEYFFRRDHHWTPAGARATAALVADFLRQQGVYQSLQKSAFRTEPGVTLVKDGTLNLALASLCGNHLGAQYVKGFRTIPEQSSEEALFAEAPPPEVVLVGTSNSAVREEEYKQFNFDGFLKQYLSVDILNYALPGAGEYGALQEYLNSGDYQPQKPPKVLLYELPANYQLSEDPLMYRQLIPAVQGRCEGDGVLVSQSSKLAALKQGERAEILSNPATGAALSGGEDYLDIRISDKNLRDFYLITYYDNGSRDKTWIRREAIVSGGQYFMELSRDPAHKNARLLSVFIEPSADVAKDTELDVRLCKG